MAISHAFSNAVPDATGTVTVWYGLTTVSVAASDIVKPSDWNSAHNQFLTIAGNTVGQSTFSGSNIVIGGGPNITISGVNATRFDISAGAGGAGDGFNRIAAGTQTAGTNTTVVFANSNGITFGMSDSSQVTASHNGLTSQSNQNVTAANGGFAFQTLSFSNVNGVSFGTSAGSAITASVAAQTNQTGGLYAVGNTTGQSSSSTFDARTLSFDGAGIVSVGWSNASLRISATQSNQAFSAGAASSTFQTLSFQDSNGISFSNNAGAIRATYTRNVASNAIASVGSATNSGTNTSRFAADDHVHAGVFSVGVSNVGNTAGDTRVDVGRFVLAGGANITLSQATAANALNTISIVAGAGGGETRLTAYAQSNTTQSSSGTIPLSSLNFAGAGIASVGITNGSVVVSVPAGGGAGDGGVFAGVSTGGNTAGSTGTVSTGNFVLVGSNGITLSQSTGGAGSHATVSVVGWPFMSRYWNGTPVSGAAGFGNSSVSIIPFSVGFPYVASNLRFAFSNTVATAANNSTAYIDLSVSAVLYSRNGSTLSSILSASASYTKTWSSNATASVQLVQQVTLSHAQTTMTPGEYFWALHGSTTNTATGGANTTALGNAFSAIIIQASVQTAVLAPAAWGSATQNTQGGVHGLGGISTGATRASIALSDISQSGSRANAANMWFEHRNVTFF